MPETPKQAARRLVDAVLVDTSRTHPDPDVRAWAWNTWRARIVARREEQLAAWRALGEAVAGAFVQVREFARAYAAGVRAALEADEDDGRRMLEAAGLDPDEEGMP